MTARTWAAWSLALLLSAVGLVAQMPDARQMSGIPMPSGDVPAGSVSVRLVRGSLADNIAGHPVELRSGEKVQTLKTDSNGRAVFSGIVPGLPNPGRGRRRWRAARVADVCAPA